jgi:hypothetical protein
MMSRCGRPPVLERPPPKPPPSDVLDFLIATQWLDEATAGDRCTIGAAMFAVLKDAARRRLDLRLSVVVWQFSIFRHRHQPHGAERGNHRDIHYDPHGPIPDFTQ